MTDPFDKLPPWERRPFMDKKEEPTIRKEALDKGCGNPDCPICYPQNLNRGGPNMPNFTSKDINRIADMMRRRQDEMILSYDVAAPDPEARLRELREPIKDLILETSHDTNWDDIVGNDEARKALFETIEAASAHKEIYEYYGMKPAKGCVLYGPPGCGKTMFGKAAASALARLHGKAVELILINGMSIESPFIGVTEAKIAAIFAYAREYQKVRGHQLVIFIDEADSLLPNRNRGAARWQISTVSSFLGEMDGLNANGAFVILATNRPEALDEALLRDGRCDRKIKVTRPGYEEGWQIIYKTLQSAKLNLRMIEEQGTLEAIAKATMDYFVLPSHRLDTITATNGATTREFPLTLANVVNGAMLTSIVSRATAYAFRRDIERGYPNGILFEDLISAVNELVRENAGIRHDYAVEEMLAEMGEKEKIAMKERLN